MRGEKLKELSRMKKGEVKYNKPLCDEMEVNDKVLHAMHPGKVVVLKAIVPKYQKVNEATGRLRNPIAAWIKGSSKNPYEIKFNERYGLSCSCPSWIYNQRGNRTCKHTEQVRLYLEVV
jgi:hypothetical protein